MSVWKCQEKGTQTSSFVSCYFLIEIISFYTGRLIIHLKLLFPIFLGDTFFLEASWTSATQNVTVIVTSFNIYH